MLSRNQVKGIETNITTLSGCERQLEAVRHQLSQIVDSYATHPDNQEQSFSVNMSSPDKGHNYNESFSKVDNQRVPEFAQHNKKQIEQDAHNNSKYYPSEYNKVSKQPIYSSKIYQEESYQQQSPTPKQDNQNSNIKSHIYINESQYQVPRSPSMITDAKQYQPNHQQMSKSPMQVSKQRQFTDEQKYTQTTIQKTPHYPTKEEYQSRIDSNSPVRRDPTLNNSKSTMRIQQRFNTPLRPNNKINDQSSSQYKLDVTPDVVLKRRLQNYPEVDKIGQHPQFAPELDTEEGQAVEYTKYINLIKNINQPQQKQLRCDILSPQDDSTRSNKKPQILKQDQSTYPLFRLLLKEVLLLREVEEHKRQIALRQDFNLLDAFRLFDSQGNGKTAAQDLISVFKGIGCVIVDLNIHATPKQINLILKQYSRRNDTMLRYSDFIRMLLPCTPDYKVMLQNRAPTFNQSSLIQELFSETSIKYFKDLLQSIITTEETIEKYKSQITENSQTLFQIMDTDQKGYLDESDFRGLFASYDVHPTALELRRVLMRFYSNTNQKTEDERITLEMFSNQIE